MPVFNLSHPPDLEKGEGGDKANNIEVEAGDITSAVSPFAAQQNPAKEQSNFTELNRSLTKQHTVSPSR